MDATITQILEACGLAKELESSLANTAANHPHYLLRSCEEIVGAFNGAIHSLHHSVDPSPFTATAPMLFADQFLHLLRPRASGSDIHITAGEFGGCGSGCGSGSIYVNSSHDMDIEAFGRRTQTAAEGSSGAGRRPAAGSSDQRSNRRRRDGGDRITRRVPAVTTGNTENPPDDGYTWRKYGQKIILGSRFPRGYYRCTHKNYYGCLAKKQIQKLDDDPYTFEVTYCGNHTCLTSTRPLLLPSLAPDTTTTAAVTTSTFNNNSNSNSNNNHNDTNNDNNNIGFSLVEGMITGQPSILSTSIQLGSWISRELEGNQTQNEQGGREGDFPVADLADVMFNSGSSGSSMNAIFSSRQE
ncbi:WRKY transcription factor 55-like [Typha latifolia]|uniref:WRKY transcription factor 55-like n=1 Tax=Typha latifolia TaxID=4733 RepID=UPI003C2E77AC